MKPIKVSVLRLFNHFLEFSYTNSAAERKRLHNIEYESENESSILGEVEIRADTVVGIALTCLKKCPDNTSELVDRLKKNSIYNSDSILDWLADDQSEFHKFFGYIVAIESLNNVVISFLEQKNSQ
jgi:hypothetical protein